MKKITGFLACLLFAAFVNAQTAVTASTAATANTSAPKANISKVLEFKE